MRPTTLRKNKISTVGSSTESSRPEIAIAANETSAPLIHKAARTTGEAMLMVQRCASTEKLRSNYSKLSKNGMSIWSAMFRISRSRHYEQRLPFLFQSREHIRDP